MPASMTANKTMIDVRVRRALATGGSRNALTPLLTASTPVIAVQPLAKDRIKSHRLAGATATDNVGGVTMDSGWPPASSVFTVPMTSTAISDTTNAYVGRTNARPASRTPRKLTTVMSTRIPRHRYSVYGCREGSAEINAPTPAEIPTATTNT